MPDKNHVWNPEWRGKNNNKILAHFQMKATEIKLPFC
jgi:hypothetical protein